MDSWGNKALHSDIKDIGQTLNSFIYMGKTYYLILFSQNHEMK